MTLIEFILSAAVAGMVVLQCVILLRLRDIHHTLALRESARRKWTRQWVRQEHDAGE